MKKIYMCVTRDKYELPIAVADSITELAEMVGVSRNTIYNSLIRARQGSVKKSVYKEVEVQA